MLYGVNRNLVDINTQLSESAAVKLAHLQRMTNQNLEEIPQQAIDAHYQQFQTQSKTPLEILQDNGLVGCIQAEPLHRNLSVIFLVLRFMVGHCRRAYSGS